MGRRSAPRTRRGVRPARRALEAFEAVGDPVPLSGGQGRAWRVGDLVLKPLEASLDALRWQADHLPLVAATTSVRVCAPVWTSQGALAVDGWTAWPFLDGSPEPGRWLDVIAAGEELHRAFRELSRPDFLAARTDRWALADRYAWGELDLGALAPSDDIRRLAALARQAPAPRSGTARATPQLVHGDLTGNVLFHPTLPPAVIDLAPYWRPTPYATGVVVADALVWEGAGPNLAYAVAAAYPDLGRFLVRALLFRVVTDRLAGVRRADPSPYAAAIELAAELLGIRPEVR